jgi:phosphoribosyl-ATP pyrophosphohydrolase/phosphoribosyl-AMP cyclohydrolase
MIIPSIDIAAGRVVQLVGGREQALDAGEPLPWLEQFRLAGEVAVVDLDAAMGIGSNRDQIAELCEHAACRVGGGIRSYEHAAWWLDRGAVRIVIGTAAQPALLKQLPRERVIVALDAMHDEVVVEGWQTGTGRSVAEGITQLEPYVSGFLVTFVEREGRLAGTDLARARTLRALTTRSLTIAGGVTTATEIAALDALGIDAQVGMAIYTGALNLGDAIGASLRSDRADELFPTVVVDEHGEALGLAWSSRESLRLAVGERRGIYQSRRRGIWIKGEQSGATQELLAVALDCDRDALRFTVRQAGTGFCHTGTSTCWGSSSPLTALEQTIRSRSGSPVPGSYTARLLQDPDLLTAKLIEEASELGMAATREAVVEEMADLIYFAMVRLATVQATRAEVDQVLARRASRITRRAGEAKVSA